jgi:hypothetical protein
MNHKLKQAKRACKGNKCVDPGLRDHPITLQRCDDEEDNVEKRIMRMMIM